MLWNFKFRNIFKIEKFKKIVNSKIKYPEIVEEIPRKQNTN